MTDYDVRKKLHGMLNNSAKARAGGNYPKAQPKTVVRIAVGSKAVGFKLA